ncbi:two-component system phosphate regulon sensor histidine kinase PhoR [Rhizobium rosettiformans]|uniref:histidine kinase n=2 Tax=Rhizobium rosettiformans TaxID=1368430 RepID=A0A4S8PT58_9HYPH|nr:phosphate regulon sensor histidine kinase PhoR [Rhizobium rosettiformans]MBB5277825.1 two-component system phosphate regulon sensor histidine kinase PhoR [Rhizobium rosettiformans]THV32985.1 phosphate regulon sensor histidine kinase PhoR [Rhizobium rosettiformans W3]
MTDDTGDGWRNDLRRVLSAWVYILAAAILSVAAWATGAATGYAVILFCLLFLLVVFRQLPVEEAPVVPAPAAEVEEPAPDPLPLILASLDGLDMPIFVLGLEAELIAQNQAAEKVFGDLVAGLHVSTRWRSPGILDMIRETIETGAPNQIEHSERHPSERVYIVRVAPVDPSFTSGASYFLLSFRDISELRRLDRMRSDFVANASHELRTPLASLRGFIETMQGPARDDAKAKDRFLTIMLDQANRMSRLVDDLLSLSRLELKAHVAPDQKVELAPILGHVRDSLAPLAAELGVEIRLDLPEEKVEVMGERDELVQVFENLMENACKYGQDGKFVDVSLRREPGGATEVSVRDHGPGIPAEHVPRLTERFYRVNVEDSRSKKGTGLGLAIVKHILTRHRARLIVRSDLGAGSVFTVRF